MTVGDNLKQARYRATAKGQATSAAYEATRKGRARTKPNLRRRFVGVDGEGGTINEHHEYLLLRAGNHCLETGQPLTTQECLAFLADLPTAGVIYVSYFFDYDSTMILRRLPVAKVSRLLDRASRTVKKEGREIVHPVDVKYGNGDHFQMDYMPHKELKVRRCWHGGKECDWKPWVTISDTGSFFQCAFVKALEQWEIGTPEQRDMIAVGKEQRADFGVVTEEEREYNILEIDLLEQLMTAFRDVCTTAGIAPQKYQGPGYLAASLLRQHGIPTRRQLAHIPPPVMRMANDAYYGGRFEATSVGPVYSGVHQYDINSAYPAAMTRLPCLTHGEWSMMPLSRTRKGDLWVGHLKFWPTEEANLYNFAVRSKGGTIFYPAEGQGVYWSVEAKAAVHQGYRAKGQVWVYRARCECQPFDWIHPLYAERLRLGKTAKGRVLKLALNSLYGKMAQSIGAAPYANPIYAGLITAMTRAQLSSAAHRAYSSCCDDVHMLATDAVFTSRPRYLQVSKDLGEWDLDAHLDLWIVQPGLYFTDKTDQPKTRGVPRQAVVEHRDTFREAYTAMMLSANLMDGVVGVPLRVFIGARIAWHRGAPETAGEWVDVVKDVSYWWGTKRDHQTTALQPAPPGVTGMPTLRTFPQQGAKDLVSVPYSKDIGRMLELQRLDMDGQPDWAGTLGGTE